MILRGIKICDFILCTHTHTSGSDSGLEFIARPRHRQLDSYIYEVI